jgi:hypothetical protein
MPKMLYFSIHLQEKCVAYHTEAPFAVDGFPDVQVHKDI